MSFSDFWENLILQHVFNVAVGATHNLYVGLLSENPLDDASGVSEPVGKGYARVKTTVPGGTSWQFTNINSGATVENAVDIDFPRATGNWGILNYFGIFNDNTSGASLCAYGSLSSSVVIENGDNLNIGSGDLKIQEGLRFITVQNSYTIAISKIASVLQPVHLFSSFIRAISSVTASLSQAFVWEDTTDFAWSDDGGFNWKDT